MSADFLIFDYETLSNNPRKAPIVSFGAIIGNWDEVSLDSIQALRDKAFYQTYKAKSQADEFGLLPNPETVRWWNSQGESAKALLNSKDKVDVKRHAPDFTQYCIDGGLTQKTVVIVRAPHFDVTIMENIFELTGYPIPYNVFKVRDVRSIVDARCDTDNGYVPGIRETFAPLGIIEHFAVDDCIKDLIQVKIAMTEY